jgi:hypothetical protein
LLPDEEDDSIFVVSEAWKVEFNQLLEDKLGDITWQEEQPPQKPPKEEIGSGWSEELATFYEQYVTVVSVFTVKPKADAPAPPPETCWTQFKSMTHGLSAMDDPFRIGIMAAILMLLVLVMVIKPFSVEHHGDRIKQVEDALLKNSSYIPTLRDGWQRRGISDRDNPALIVLMEIEKATPDSKKSEPPSSANSTPLPPPPKCYIAQSGDNTIEQIAGYFYNPVTREITDKIIFASASIHQGNNGDKQIYSLKKGGKWGTSKYLDGKMEANWQFVIPNPTTTDSANLQKLKDCYSISVRRHL